MVEIVFGTSNSSKIAQIRSVLEPRGIEVVGLNGIILDVVEDGASVAENALKKARAYATHVNQVVMSMDNGLYFKGFAPEEQPGVHVRRIGKKLAATDEEMIAYYANLVKERGGELTAHWHFALALARPDGQSRQTTVITPPRRFVGVPCERSLPGYPLEQLQVDDVSGKYIAQMTSEEHDEFWRRTIGKQIADFVELALQELKF